MLYLVDENTLKFVGNVHSFSFKDVDFGWNLLMRVMFFISNFIRLICVSYLVNM